MTPVRLLVYHLTCFYLVCAQLFGGVPSLHHNDISSNGQPNAADFSDALTSSSESSSPLQQQHDPSASNSSTAVHIDGGQDTGVTEDPEVEAVTLRVSKPLLNISLEAGETLRLRCEFSGRPQPNRFLWFRNEVQLERSDLRRGQLRRPQRLRSGSWRLQLRIADVETHDAGYYRCQAGSGRHTAQSTGIVQVHPARSDRPRHSTRGKFLFDNMDMPLFPSGDPVFDFPVDLPPKNDMGAPDGELPGGLRAPPDPSQLSGSCQLYSGRVCLPFLANSSVFVTSSDLQQQAEQRVVTALGVVSQSPDLSKRCGDFAVRSICAAALPPCTDPVGRGVADSPRQLCRDECELLRDEVCRLEYAIARKHPLIGLKIHLPSCQRLPTLGSPAAASCLRLGLDSSPAVQSAETCREGDGSSYRGTVSRAASGRPCLPWHMRSDYSALASRQPALRGGHSFCRNWDSLERQPWCYTDSAGRELCAVPVCTEPLLWHVLIPCLTLAAALLLMLISCCLWRRMRHKAASASLHKKLSSSMAAASVELSSLLPESRVQEVAVRRVRLLQQLGEGAFGKVYRAELLGAAPGQPTVAVAVKTLQPDATLREQQEFRREAELLAELQHPNVIQLLGAVLRERPLCMLFQYMRHGDLHEFVSRHAPSQTGGASTLRLQDMLAFAVQVAAGMDYLSSQHYVHRDLAARNCLVGDNLNVKVSDFGLSRDIYAADYYRVQNKALLPVRWMPAESILYGKFTVSSDVWSFAVLLWEIFSYGKQPYHGYSNSEVTDMIRRRQLLPRPDQCPPAVHALMMECWHETPSRRPVFRQLHGQLLAWQLPSEAAAPGSQSSGSAHNTTSTSLSRLPARHTVRSRTHSSSDNSAPRRREPTTAAYYTDTSDQLLCRV